MIHHKGHLIKYLMFLLGLNSNSSSNSRALQQYLFSLLQCCKTTKQLFQIHTQIVLNGFTQKNFLVAKLLSFYVIFGNVQYVNRAFEQIENPSTIVWNQMIRGYAKSETPERSVQLYNEMVRAQTEHDAFTYSFVLNACAKARFLREGEQLHGRVLSMGLCANEFVETNLVNMYAMAGGDTGVIKARKVFDTMTQRNVVTWNSMLAMYLRLGCVDEARETFNVMPERNGVSWTTMIAGCVHSGKSRQALALYYQMWRARVEVDEVTMVATLSACAELGDLETGRWIHSYVDKTFGSTNQLKLVSLNNAIIHMYASSGVIEEAYRVFKKMKRRSIVSWTTVITGLAKQGRGSEALDVFRSMLSVGEGERVLLPDEVTFLGVLCACSHTGMVNEGRHYFRYMTQMYGIEPRIEHYGCFVDLLSRAGLLDEAYELIGTMSLKPSEAVWGALLGGCRIHRNIKLASYVGDNLISELKPNEAAMGYFTLLSNAYASADRWVDVANIRQKMVEMGVKKPPGHSQIQVNGVIHYFVAGDWTHKDAYAIHEVVGEITMQTILELQFG